MTRLVLLALALAAGVSAVPAAAQTSDLDGALRAFARQRSIDLVYSGDLVAGKTTRCPAATRAARRPVSVVLACLLEGTGLEARRLPSGTFALYRVAVAPPVPRVPPAAPPPAPGPGTAEAPPVSRPAAPAPVTVSGTVTDAATGETLIGAAVYAPVLGRGATTNAYGFYSLTVPPGATRVVASYVGLATDDATLALTGDLTRDLALRPDSTGLGEVVIEARDAALDRATPSVALAGDDVQSLPAILGEADVLKALQFRPGVSGGAEGTSGLQVRGGTPDQTLILLDGTPVYNASHVFGFLSVFNADAVKRVELFTGGFPARYGGRLSSVVDVRMREGNEERRAGHARIGLLSSQILAEGPVADGGYMIAGRRTYLDLLVRPFLSDLDVTPTAYFYDLNAKVNTRLGDRDRVFLSLYRGRDQFGLAASDADGGAQGGLGWGNVTGALRWTRLISNQLFAATTLTASDYRFSVGLDADRLAVSSAEPRQTFSAQYTSGVRDLALQTDLEWTPSADRAVTAGGAITRHRYAPGAFTYDPLGAPAPLRLGSGDLGAWEGALYAEDERRLGAAHVSAGVRATALAVQGTAYGSMEPRLAARLPVGGVSLRGSVTRMTQYLHLLTAVGGIGLPTDIWVPATERVGPERAWQATVGVADAAGPLRWSLDAYAKQMTGLVAYAETGDVLRADVDWQDQVTRGDGRSAGLEVSVEHAGPRTQAQLAYTLSRTDRRFDAIDDGARFPFRYDRTHDLGVAVRHRLSERLDVSGAFVYQTGQAVTLPEVTYLVPSPGVELTDEPLSATTGTPQVQAFAYGPRNGYRLPATLRLDLGLDLYFRRGPRPHALSFEVYNATNRANASYVELEARVDPETGVSNPVLTGRGLLPLVPSVSYQFSF